MMRQLFFVLVLLCAVCGRAEAACSGSRQTWSCTAGTTKAEVASAYARGTDGMVITLAVGTYTWSGTPIQFLSTKGATIICAVEAACNVSSSGVTFYLPEKGDTTKLYRWSGVNFTSLDNLVMWSCPGGGCSNVITQFRFDHNVVPMPVSAGAALLFGEATNAQYIYGVIDHNTFTAASNVLAFKWVGATDATPPASPFGTAENLFFEDNQVLITAMNDAGTGCFDGWGQMSIVVRRTVFRNCLLTAHGVLAGGGPQNAEVYDNDFGITATTPGANFDDCYRCLHWQGGGETIIFNNVLRAFSGKSGNAIEVTHYRSLPAGGANTMTQCGSGAAIDGNRSPDGRHHGYPCWRQPGRDFAGHLKPMYAWNNRWFDTGAKVDLVLQTPGDSPDYFAAHLQNNRDYYNAVSKDAQTSASSPFSGATGTGFGTLANRPTTCTTNPDEAGGGVGYFATDIGPQGTLYRCSATNTWTQHYRPYCYPHPLTTGGVCAEGSARVQLRLGADVRSTPTPCADQQKTDCAEN